MARVPVTQSKSREVGSIGGSGLRQINQPSIGAGLSDLGAGVYSFEKNRERENKVFKKANDARILNDEVAKATLGLSAKTNELKSNPDSFESWGKDVSEYSKTVLDDARTRLNPEVYGAFESQFKNMAVRNQIDVQNSSRKVLVDKGRASIDSNLNVYNDLYAKEQDPDARKNILGQAYIAISDAQNTGLITEQEAGTTRDAFLKSIETTRLKNDILNDPDKAKENFDSYAIPEEDKPALSKQINSAIEAKQKDIKAEKAEKERLEKIVIEEAREKIGDLFFEKLNTGALSYTDIANSKLPPTGENSKQYWEKQRKDREKAIKTNPGKWETDTVVEADLVDRILNDPKSVDPTEITALGGSGLSTDDVIKYSKLRKTQLGKDGDPQKTIEAKFAYQQLGYARTSKMWDASNRVNNDKKWAESHDLLKNWIDKHPGEDPKVYVDKLMQPVKNGWIDSFFNYVKDDYTTPEEQQKIELEAEAGVIKQETPTTEQLRYEIQATVKTKEDYDALPSGTIFIEDGVKYRKP